MSYKEIEEEYRRRGIALDPVDIEEAEERPTCGCRECNCERPTKDDEPCPQCVIGNHKVPWDWKPGEIVAVY